MKIHGFKLTRKVYIDDVELSPADSLKVRNHSPGGFSWGYGGSGPAQLALAIMMVVFKLGPKIEWDYPVPRYQNFKWDHVSKWQGDFKVELDPEELRKNYAWRRPRKVNPNLGTPQHPDYHPPD